MEDYEVPAALRAELADLQDNWGKAYVVYVTQGGTSDEWTAERRGGADAPPQGGQRVGVAHEAEARLPARAGHAVSAESVGDWEVDRLRADFGIGWIVAREPGGRLKAISRDGRRTLDGPSEAVLRCHLLDAQFPRLRPA